MLIKIIIGFVIGLFSAIALFSAESTGNKSMLTAVSAVFLIVSIGFIISSFLYGAIYGAMAIGEIAIGLFVGYKVYFN